MKNLSNFLFFIVISMMFSLSSCQKDEPVTGPSGSGNNVAEMVADNPDDVNAVIINQEIYDSLKSVKSIFVGTEEDLFESVQKARALFLRTLMMGTFDDYLCSVPEFSRASITKYTEYVTRPVVMPEDIHARMFFKSKFGSQIVNKINALVSPERKISTGTTYCCYWNVFYHPAVKNSGQKYGPTASPNCALHPNTRDSYEKRGYEITTTDRGDGTTVIHMYSFELVILYEDTDKPTSRLDIYYPRIMDPSPWTGYEFIYYMAS
ncbi:MAG: hypothetical protein K2K37_03260 [Muribaculaceae bacterium]|nr:hypothetical protein [Muribaculaceae bacterium]